MATSVGGLNVPPLQREDRIEDWERLFRAAVVPLLAQDGGERLAINMLPAFICRRVAEREIAREVVTEAQTLDEAFKTLRDNLDPPVDCMKAMQEIRDGDWEPGTYIDDYFYQLKAATTAAKAPLRIACVVLITQLPPSVQSLVNDWLAEKDDVNVTVAREFINKVRKTLAEKGIPLDKGHRDFAKVCGVKIERMPLNDDGPDGSTVQSAEVIKTPNKPWNDSAPDPVSFVQRGDRHMGPWRSRGSRGRSTKYQNQRPSCFECRSTEHFQRACPSQYCQSCGKKGHDRRDCYSKRQVFSVGHVSSTNSRYLNESGVIVSLQLNEIQTTVMLDSGAQPSIIDTESLEKLGVDCRGRPGRVHGVCATPIKTRGVVDLEVDFGARDPVEHKFIVLDSREQTVILGRDFLKRFR